MLVDAAPALRKRNKMPHKSASNIMPQLEMCAGRPAAALHFPFFD